METKEKQAGRLRPNALGVAGIVFFVVAAAGPLAATLGASPIAFMNNGAGTPGAFALAGVVLLLFAVGYAAMSAHVTSAGGFAVYVSRAFGQKAGISAAFVALVAYSCMLLGLYALTGLFAESTFDSEFGVHLPWQAWTMIAIAAVGVLGYRNVNLSARVLGTLMVLEVLILLVFAVAVLATGGEDGLSAKPFDPGEIFQGTYGIAFLFAFASFIGFEATAIYGEEARNPRRTVPRATYVAVILIAVFYALSTYAITVAVGADKVGAVASEDPVGFVFAANTRFVGSWSTHVMNVLVVTSFFAVILAFHNTLARYMYSLGRGGVLPRQLGWTHGSHQSPYAASLAGTALGFVVLGIFMLAGSDPFAAIYSWLAGIGTVGVLVLQAAVSIVVVVFFRRTRLDRRVWPTVIAPVLGAAGLIYGIVMSIQQFEMLTGTAAGVVGHLYWAIPIAAVVGLVVGVVRLSQGADLERGFGEETAPADDATSAGLATAEPASEPT